MCRRHVRGKNAAQAYRARLNPALQEASMSFLLKILSGTLSGVEYTLPGGDTVFHVGPHQDLVDGTAARVLGQADNAYFVPGDLPRDAFLVRLPGTGGEAQLGERVGADAGWTLRPLPLQQPLLAASTHFAVRRVEDAWATAVTGFVAPSPPTAMPAEPADAATPRRRRPAVPAVLVALGLLAAVGGGAAWYHWHYLPEARVRGLATVLRDSASDYVILPGAQNRLYAFTDDPAGRTWGERASRRLRRNDDIYLVRRAEVQRLDALLVRAGITPVVVRLDDPARPEIVLSASAGRDDSEQRARRALDGHISWAHSLQISSISDPQLVALATNALSVLGIGTRTEPAGRGLSVVNDVFLDDAGLQAMIDTARAFHQRWGQRRITIQPRLWDDLLQGRSYRYTQDQLLSVGSGRWAYARGTSGAVHAAP